MRRIIFLLLNIVFSHFSIIDLLAQAEGEQISYGKYRKVYSQILKEERTLLIYLPEDYHQSNKHYPVIYQLDGSNNQFLRGIYAIERLTSEKRIPEVIYIAIANTKRNRDMYPFKTVYHEISGGADNFLKFLTGELIPFVNDNYRTTSFKSIIGFSASGQFVLYALLDQPEAFDTYIACSPAISFNMDFYKNKLMKFLNQYKSVDKTLSIVYGSAEGKSYYGEQFYFGMKENINVLIDIFKHQSPKGFHWNVTAIEGGLHVPHGCIYEGVKTIFQGWRPILPPEIIPNGGFLSNGDRTKICIKTERGEIHYTTDGSEPTQESKKYTKEIIIDKLTSIKAKTYIKNLGESKTNEAVYNHSPNFQASTIDKLRKGIQYDYYENNLYQSTLPNFENTWLVESGITDKFDISKKKRYEGFAFSFEGYINIKNSGRYTFYLKSNDESKLLINNKTVVYKTQSYDLPEKSGTVNLEKGKHKIRILYVGPPFQRKLSLLVCYKGPNLKKQEIPPDVLFL